MKEILKNWTFARFAQLLVGIYFLSGYFSNSEAYLIAFGGMMFVQAVLNIGCFSSKGCSTPAGKVKFDKNKDYEVEYEEVK